MTTLPEAVEAIVGRFVTRWALTAYGSVPYTLDGEVAFKPPSTGSYLRLAPRHYGAHQETLGEAGNRRFNRTGALLVDVFADHGKAPGSGLKLAHEVRHIFEGVALPGTTVYFQDVIVRELGVDGRWYRVQVEARFYYEELK